MGKQQLLPTPSTPTVHTLKFKTIWAWDIKNNRLLVLVLVKKEQSLRTLTLQVYTHYTYTITIWSKILCRLNVLVLTRPVGLKSYLSMMRIGELQFCLENSFLHSFYRHLQYALCGATWLAQVVSLTRMNRVVTSLKSCWIICTDKSHNCRRHVRPDTTLSILSAVVCHWKEACRGWLICKTMLPVEVCRASAFITLACFVVVFLCVFYRRTYVGHGHYWKCERDNFYINKPPR